MPTSSRHDLLRHGLAVVLFLGLALAGRQASASDFQVSPVLLTIADSQSSGLLTVTNRAATPLRFQIEAFAWDESREGRMELRSTEQVIVFPSILTIAPGESRKVRVGTQRRADGEERSYRVFVSELPPLDADRVNGVSVLTRMGIPVFVRTSEATPAPSLADVELAGRDVAFSLRNAGSAHFRARSIRVAALDDRGANVFTHEEAGWYVLAGNDRRYRVPLPEQACAATKLLVDVDTGTGNVRKAVRLEAPLCP